MSLTKTFIDNAETTWQFKENVQRKIFTGQIDTLAPVAKDN